MGGAASRGAAGQKREDFQLQGTSLHSPPGRKPRDPMARANQGQQDTAQAPQAPAGAVPARRPKPEGARADKFAVPQGRAGKAAAAKSKPWGEKPPTPQELASEEVTPRAQAARRKLEEQEDLSIEQQMAQQYKAFEAEQKRKEAGSEAARRKLEEQEDLSIEQQMAQQYKAFEAEQKRKEAGSEAARRKLEEQEDLSIELQMVQQYKAFAKQKQEQEALAEADDLLNAFGPPRNSTASTQPHTQKSDQKSNGGTSDARSSPEATRSGPVKNERPLATSFSPDSGDQEMRNEVSCILPEKLFLTNFRGVENVEELQRLNIKHILCVNEQSNSHPDKFNYFNIDTLEDQEDHDATPYFVQVKKFTDKAIKSGGGVVFHCAAGISRSATMMISYLMASKRLSLYEAFQLTYTRRRVTWPNRAFMRQLIVYERKLQGDGWLTGKTPSITLATWDAWTSGEDAMSHAKLAKQQSVKEMERQSSLKGKDTAQFQRYLAHMAKQPAATKR